MDQNMETFARGPNFVYGKEYILHVHGPQVWDSMCGRLPDWARTEWQRQHLASGEYSFGAFKQGVHALSDVAGDGSPDTLARMYEHIADRSLSAIYKVFFRATRPSFVIRNYPKLWSRFFTVGDVQVPVAEAGRARVEFTVPEAFLDWLPPACLGFSRKAVHMAGGRDVAVTDAGVERRGDAHVACFDLAWRE